MARRQRIDEPEFTNFVEPNPILLEALNHGADRGFTTFHKKDPDGKLRGIASVPAAQACLPGIWDQLTADLANDSYASINLMYRHGHAYARPGLVDADGKQLRRPHRDCQSLCRLNACWVDIDHYRLGLTKGEVIGQIVDAQESGVIPSPSVLQFSGRGVWAFWLLDGTNGAWPEQVALWNRIQRRLTDLFGGVGADRNSMDGARIARVAGSLNPKANSRVNVAFLSGDEGTPRYSLDDLAKWFDVSPAAKPTAAADGTKKIGNQVKGYRGQAARWAHDEERFWRLVEQVRRGVREGLRHAHCFILGRILAHRYRDLEERAAQVDRQAHRLWGWFSDRKDYSPTQTEKEIRQAAFGGKLKLTHTAIAERLEVTEDEAIALAVLTSRTTASRTTTSSWPSKDGPVQIPRPLKPHEKAERRHQWIRDNSGFARQATVRQLAEALTAAGMPCSPPTAAKDRDIAIPMPTSTSTPRTLF